VVYNGENVALLGWGVGEEGTDGGQGGRNRRREPAGRRGGEATAAVCVCLCRGISRGSRTCWAPRR
jgi:hypothetical protein